MAKNKQDEALYKAEGKRRNSIRKLNRVYKFLQNRQDKQKAARAANCCNGDPNCNGTTDCMWY